MAADFDAPPLYDRLTKKNEDYLGDIWVSYWSSFFQTLIGYLSQFGIFVPPLTTQQISSIQNPTNGQVVYNTTTQTFQGYENGAWKTFTLT